MNRARPAAILAAVLVAASLPRLPSVAAAAGRSPSVTPGVSLGGRPVRVLWYRQPAAEWSHALPVGNGRLGAMVFGGIEHERIQLNEDTLWSGGPYDPTRPGGAAALPEVRRLLFAGARARAHDLFGRTMMGVPYEQQKYQPLGDLLLAFPGHAGATEYRRELDLDSAVARVRYRVGDVTFTREVLSSPVDQVLVVRISADRPSVVDLDAELHGVRNTQHSNYGTGYFRMDGQPPGGLVLTGRSSDYLGIEGRLRYRAEVHAEAEGGEVTVDYRTLQVRGADAVTLRLAAATSFVDYRDVSADPQARTDRVLAAARRRSWEQIRADAVAEHRRLFRRVSLQLERASPSSDDDPRALPTDERLARVTAGAADPDLEALYFQFGRYLLIASSRPGTQAANLQGLWNQDSNPSWDSKYTVNINLPMNYWAAEVTALPETEEPLWDLIRDVAETGRSVAREHWGARGWVLHQNTDLWRAAAPMDGPSWGAWPLGGAWLSLDLWEHYRYSRDADFLRRAMPVLRGAVRFALDILVEHPRHGWLVTAPSSSPENFPAYPGNGRFFDETTGLYLTARTMVAGPTMDTQILRALFDAYGEATRVLGEDGEVLSAEAAAARDRLAPEQIGKHGQLQEWLEDWDEIEPHHRHLSPLWGLYPGEEITPEGTPGLARAAAVSLRRRGPGGCGWSYAWKVALWARLRQPEEAHRELAALLADRTLPSLFSLCGSAMQVDANLGAAAGIAEMLLQSHAGEIRLLPALPSSWPSGRVTGLRARGGLVLDLNWREGRLEQARLHAERDGSILLRVGEDLVLTPAASITATAAPGIVALRLRAGEDYEVASRHPR